MIGGNGFIGSHVVDALVARGHTVSAFDRFGRPGTQFASAGVTVIPGDFLNVSDVRAAVEGQDVVLHLLSTTDPATAENDPTLDIRTNVLASVELFKSCVDARTPRVVFASTGGAIYGDQDSTRFSETDLTLPVSPYAIGKLAIENYLAYFRRKHDLESTVFRISNPYGTRQNPRKRQGVIPIFLRRLADSEPVTVFGDGSMVRDYLYVEDLAQMIAEAAPASPRHAVYNLGSGRGVSLREILTTIAAATGREPQVVHRPLPPTFVDHVTLDVTRFESEFASRPTTTLLDGISRTWKDIVSDHEH